MARRDRPSQRLPAGGLTQPQVQALIAQQVQPVTSSRMFSQTVVQPGDTLTASTTTEQTYATQMTIPANSLVLGQSIIVDGAGIYTTSLVAPTQRARLRLGGTTLVDSSAQSVVVGLTAALYEFRMHVIVRATGPNGLVEATARLIYATGIGTAVTILAGPTGAYSTTANPVSIDTTQANALTLSCQFGAIGSGNTNSLRELSIHTLKPVSS